ncbi:hypothetical protein M1771_06385 [Spiroplasma citri]|uniref:YjeF N-terminal domain-containing protein n=1 Tax=Spiroplasma citri TaxID=2133 RepID=A0AAX3SWN4_SPICI|nr:hypothetical protein [Spiroplasma citri]WFG95735.1 hypothetical protein M0C40_06435 [Spiroplasma citri]WFG99620.1 hypothetical protein M1771_06385 [Spiroplasma citri]
MLYISNQQDTKNLENFIFNQFDIPPVKLMAKAAEGLFHHLNLAVHSFLILTNVGNNGWDGFCLAKLINDYDGTKKIHINICTDKKTFDNAKTRLYKLFWGI